ncbi:unnamed protein product, partial [Brassica oleracea]
KADSTGEKPLRPTALQHQISSSFHHCRQPCARNLQGKTRRTRANDKAIGEERPPAEQSKNR